LSRPKYIPGRSGQTLAPDDRRVHQQIIRLSNGEREYLHLLAKTRNMQVAEYLRACAFENDLRPLLPDANKVKWTELSRLASNLNQLAHANNAGLEVNSHELSLLLNETLNEVKKLRQALLGIPAEEPLP